MFIPLLLAATFAVYALSIILLRSSGAGRQLFGRDAWIHALHLEQSDDLKSGTFLEHHEFWLDGHADRDFWAEVPDDGEEDEQTEEVAHLRAVGE